MDLTGHMRPAGRVFETPGLLKQVRNILLAKNKTWSESKMTTVDIFTIFNVSNYHNENESEFSLNSIALKTLF